MVLMTCVLYLLAVSSYVAFYIFQNDVKMQPEWTGGMLNNGIGQKLI